MVLTFETLKDSIKLSMLEDFYDGSMYDLITKCGNIHFEKAREYIITITKAMAFLHFKNIVYRGYSCKSIKFDNNEVKIRRDYLEKRLVGIFY